MTTRFRRRQPGAARLQMLQQPEPDRRHRRRHGDALAFQQLVQRGTVELRAGHDQLRPGHRRGIGQRPAIGVEQRHHRHHRVARGQAEEIRRGAGQRMQHVRAVRIEHALGAARGARGVAEPGRRVLVELRPGEIVIRLREPVLIGHGPFQRGLRHMRRIGEDHIARDARQLRLDLLDQRHEGEVEEQHPVPGIVDDPGDLLGEEPGIDGVRDRADAADAVPELEMAVAVPGQRRHPVAVHDALAGEPFRHGKRAPAHLRIGRAPERPVLDRPADDLARAVLDRGMVDDPVQQKGPVLHQAEHARLSPHRSVLVAGEDSGTGRAIGKRHETLASPHEMV